MPQFQRDIASRVKKLAAQFPVIILTGARQTGKTTLLKQVFSQYRYVSLDLPSAAEAAERTPEAFLGQFPCPVVIDEVQYAPQLFRHIKLKVDQNRHTPGQYILTGSQKFTLMKEVGDSLAGRCGWLELETLSYPELQAGDAVDLSSTDVLRVLARGGFPELWRVPEHEAGDFYRGYLATYIERDVRQLLNITSLRDFERFIRLCATYNGQLLNKTELGKGVGITAKTVNQWLSVLEASNQIQLLEPYFGNLGKRIVKSPKLYFKDTGLLCFLLGFDQQTLQRTPYVGAVWEAFVHAELRKLLQQTSANINLWFYRDQQGREVDFLVERGDVIAALECKWSELPTARDARSLSEVAAMLLGPKARPMHSQAPQFVVARPAMPFPLDEAHVIHGAALHQALDAPWSERPSS